MRHKQTLEISKEMAFMSPSKGFCKDFEISGFGVYAQVADTWTNSLSIPSIHLAELEAVCNIWCDLFDRC
jgi:hypothetical protein